jgi:hypothetical protein
MNKVTNQHTETACGRAMRSNAIDSMNEQLRNLQAEAHRFELFQTRNADEKGEAAAVRHHIAEALSSLQSFVAQM